MRPISSALLLAIGAVLVLVSTGEVVEWNNTSGIIVAPEDPSGTQGYEPNARRMWILDVQDPTLKLELSVASVDLGQPFTTIHDDNGNYSMGDFLLVGAGRDIMLGDDYMFYGTRTAPRKVVVQSGVAHVFFYSTTTVTKATGFTITYNTTGMVTTEAPTTTTPAPPILSSAVISINGIPTATWFEHNETFFAAISSMASDYEHVDLNMTTIDVPPSDVIINEAKTCHPQFCPEGSCVAYDFSLATLTDMAEVAFSKEDLERMLADASANAYIGEAFGSQCQICDDEPSVSIVMYIVIPLVVVIVGVAFTFAAWKLSDRSTMNQGQEKYEQAQRDKIDDQRKWSAEDVSILGLGLGSVASRGSLYSRRFTMPFPKARTDDSMDENAQDEVDTSEFVHFDPDSGMTHPEQFGLRTTGLASLSLVSPGNNEYVNKAFVPDSPSPATFQLPSLGLGSDSSDSEDGGALTFTPKRQELTVNFEVPAEVHTSNIEETTDL